VGGKTIVAHSSFWGAILNPVDRPFFVKVNLVVADTSTRKREQYEQKKNV
jgi:hypothetical protein